MGFIVLLECLQQNARHFLQTCDEQIDIDILM
jgi:hypothetical protein